MGCIKEANMQRQGKVATQACISQQNGNSLQDSSMGSCQKTWQTDADVAIRRVVLGNIFRLFHKRKQNATPEWQRKLPDFVKHLEEQLYFDASSKKEYFDLQTLEQRLQSVAKCQRLKNNPTVSSHLQGPLSVNNVIPTCAIPSLSPAHRNPSHMITTPNGGSMIPTPGAGSTMGKGQVASQACTSQQNGNSLQGSSKGSWQKTWQTDADISIRHSILGIIFHLYQKRKQQFTPELQQQLPDFVNRLERQLYHDASSREEYLDLQTFKQRLRSAAKRLTPKNNPSVSSHLQGSSLSVPNRAIGSPTHGKSSDMIPTTNGGSMLPTLGVGSNMGQGLVATLARISQQNGSFLQGSGKGSWQKTWQTDADVSIRHGVVEEMSVN